MAQTDARPGFRLPWNSERSNSEQTDIDETAQSDDTARPDAVKDGSDWPTNDQAVPADESLVGDTEESGSAEAAAPAAPPAPRRPSQFMEDLSKAMQAAAEEARTRTLGQFQADAKSHIDQIHSRLTTETTDLRRKADDDLAAVREWSKVEIARIREETEGRIITRKSQLESDIATHATHIEREIEIVLGRVSEFEAEMAAFFERLLAEDDPTRIATMAERLPEPPAFDTVADVAAALMLEAPSNESVAGEPDTDEATEESASSEAETVSAEDGEATIAADEHGGQAVRDGFAIDREAAFAAVQAAAEAAASAEVATDAANRAEDLAELTMGMVGAHESEVDGDQPDFGAAEVEAATSFDGTGSEITEITNDDLAARLAGLVPGKAAAKAHSNEATSTQVVVVGLVSVASIASFKRHLGRVSGVQSVGVSSGPDGEFVFAVHHSADVALRDAIPSLPSFQARVTSITDGVLNVAAHDPESDH
jgi:hypothetical protein